MDSSNSSSGVGKHKHNKEYNDEDVGSVATNVHIYPPQQYTVMKSYATGMNDSIKLDNTLKSDRYSYHFIYNYYVCIRILWSVHDSFAL